MSFGGGGNIKRQLSKQGKYERSITDEERKLKLNGKIKTKRAKIKYEKRVCER
jgi:hypothetical protein